MTLVLILFVVWIGLCLLLGTLAIFLQSYLNETPPDIKDVAIRAPIGGTLLAIFFSFWCFLATRNPDRWAPLVDFSPNQDLPYFTEMSVTYYPNLKVSQIKKERPPESTIATFSLKHGATGKQEYRDNRNNVLPAQPAEITVMDGGERVTFKPERDDKGNIKIEKNRGLRYFDDRGRMMEEGYLGQITIRRTGWLITYVLLNLVHLAVWVIAAGPILRFSAGQSIVIMVVAWATTSLFVMPPILRQARTIYEKREQESKQSEKQETKKSRREELGFHSPASLVRTASPGRTLRNRQQAAKAFACVNYFAATDEGNSTLTLLSSPALTATRSSFTSPLYSTFRV